MTLRALTEQSKQAFFNAIQTPFEVEHPGLAHTLLGEKKQDQNWTIHTVKQDFTTFFNPKTPGALLYILGDKKTINDEPIYNKMTHLYLHTNEGELSPKPSRYAGIIPNHGTYRKRLNNTSAFGHLILIRQGKRNILLLICMQKVMNKVKSKRLTKKMANTINLAFSDAEGLSEVMQDLHQMSQGPTRHYSMIDAALQIAERMKQQGINVEVHVPHPEAIYSDKITGGLIKKPLLTLQRHFKEDRLREQTDEAQSDPTENCIKTINLSRPKTRAAKELLKNK